MPDISNLQPSFHGGEWSPFTQGRMDRQDYRKGMETCLNTIPLEEGSATRRPGFRRLGYTRGGGYAAMREFHFNVSEPYNIELTDLHLRLWGGSPLGLNSSNLIMENGLRGVASVSTANPAVVATAGAHAWSTGDTVMFRQPDGATNMGYARLLNRQFIVTVLSSTAFSIADAVTGASFDGSTVTTGGELFASRVYDQVTPWSAAEVASVRTVQDNKTVALFQAAHKPRLMVATAEPSTCSNAEFTFNAGDLLDGPYFDPYDNAPLATADALSGIVGITLSGSAYPFVATDVGRAMRLFSEPPEWDEATSYAAGDSVRKFDDYYTSLEATTGDDPFSTPAKWLANPAAARWAWGFIETVTDATHATVNISSASDLLYTTPMRTWRMGLYSDTTGWPTGGVFHESRLWIWGTVIPNRIDGSKTNEGFSYGAIGVFSPTGWDGTVADNNGVAAVYRADQTNPIFWGVSDDQGLLCGTKAGEWLIRSGGGADDAITPTSIRAKRISRYGSSDVEPTRVGDAIMFTGRFNRKLYEYMADASASSPRYSASNLTLKAKHLTATGIAEVVYQQELVPVLWVRTLAGALIGCTYKKDGEYSNIPEDIQGWHRHTHGDAGRVFECIQTGPTGQGLDTLYAVTYDPTTGYRQVEQLQLIFGQNAEAATGNFLDASVVPTAAEVIGSSVRYYGLDHMEGLSVTAWVAGLDMGEFTVTDGAVTVPFNDSFNLAKLAEVSTGSDYFGLTLTFASGISTMVPASPNVLSITEYQVGAESLDNPGDAVQIDWTNGKAYSVVNGHGLNAGFRRFNLFTGALEQARSAQAIHGSPTTNVALGTISPKGNIFCMAGGANDEALFKIRGSDLELIGTLGTPGSSGIINAGQLCAILVGGREFVVGSGFVFPPVAMQVIDADAMSIVATYPGIDAQEKNIFLARSENKTIGCAESGSIFGLGKIRGTDPFPSNLNVYEVRFTASEGVVSNDWHVIGSITPPDVDPAWTNFGTGGGATSFNVDQTDGNLLACVYGDGSTPTNTYLIKINAVSGAIMWKIGGQNPNLGGVEGTVIRFGRFAYKSGTGVSGAYPVTLIDTVAGTASSGGNIVDVSGTSLWDGVHGFLVGGGAFTPSHTGAPTGTNTSGFAASFYHMGGTSGSGGVTDYKAPAVFGFTYTSRGKVLRPILDAGAANGPALGKTRRAHMYSILLQRSGPIKIGCEFDKLRPIPFKTAGGTPYEFGVLYSGIVWDTVEDDYSFNGQLAWEITRPVPCTVLALTTFMQAQDR